MTNYQRGYATELRAKRILERRGYFVVRSAGSHGEADLVALHKELPCKVVQVKRNAYVSREERTKLKGLKRVLAWVDVEIWRFIGRGKPVIEQL